MPPERRKALPGGNSPPLPGAGAFAGHETVLSARSLRRAKLLDSENGMNRRRMALALEYPLMQQGGTEVLVQSLLRGFGREFEIVLVSGDKSRDDLPAEMSGLISAHLNWTMEPRSSEPARALADQLQRHGVELAHFHFGGTFTWGSNRYWRCPVYHLAG